MFVQWKNIVVDFDNFKLNLNLNINKGELVTLLGPSGCGKTTALRVASGFQKPDSGDFILDNIVLNNVPVDKRDIGIVFQNYALFPHMNVEKNISYGLSNRGLSKNMIKEKVDFILESLHLPKYNNRSITELSGGEKQRVALGRSLAIEPKLLLLDEPLSALDADLRKKLRYEIKRVQKELQITTLYVTHDQEEALAVSDRVALLKSGVLQQFSTPKDIYDNPNNEFVARFIGESNLIEKDGKRLFFRPEHVKPGTTNSGINFRGKIVKNEFLGHFSRGIFRTENNLNINVISFDHHHQDNYYVEYKDFVTF